MILINQKKYSVKNPNIAKNMKKYEKISDICVLIQTSDSSEQNLMGGGVMWYRRGSETLSICILDENTTLSQQSYLIVLPLFNTFEFICNM